MNYRVVSHEFFIAECSSKLGILEPCFQADVGECRVASPTFQCRLTLIDENASAKGAHLAVLFRGVLLHVRTDKDALPAFLWA